MSKITREDLSFPEGIKPCRGCGFCPYGILVEEFPLVDNEDEFSCSIFGHDCPVFYVAEPYLDDGEVSEEDFIRMGKAFDSR